ncbi:MAG: Ig-like domain-containing protein [Saprospiraceae bacterium]
MKNMQRVAFILFFVSLLGRSDVWSQDVYNYREILVNSSVKDRLNPCYYLNILDSTNHGSIDTIKLGNGKLDLVYQPDAGYIGTDTLVIEYYKDVTGNLQLVYKSFVYNVVNSHLELRNDYISVYKNQINIEYNPLVNDSSSLNGTNNISIKAIPAYNSLQSNISILSDSIVKFSTPSGYDGSASFTYRVCDALGLCKEAVVNVSIIDSNSIKTIDTIVVYTAEDYSIQLLLPYSGFSIDQNAKHGKLDILDASFLYKPYKDFNGNDTFKLIKGNLSRLVLVTVIPQVESNSIIVPDIVFTPVSTEIVFDVSINDVTAIVKNYAIGIDQTTSKGTLTKINSKGLFKYVPENDYTGVQTFSYKVCPQGVCESAKVKIYIGDYEPITDNPYEINTYKNTPVLLSYQVPVNAYNFSANTDSIKFYPAWDTVNIVYNGSCTSELIGYNQLVFYPKLNYVHVFPWQNDTVKINYCISGTNNCVEAELLVHIYNESKNCVKQCVGDCVWPGDVDMSGSVDMKDLLSLGCELGKTGKQRTYTGNNFRSHTSANWGDNLMNTSVDLKNADCNGDSTINSTDTLAIFNSYRMTHSLVPKEVYSKGSFPIDFNILTPDADSGDIGMIEVILGDDQYPAINVSGYAYDLDFNTYAINEASLYVDYYEKGWFARSATTLNMFKKPWAGRLESGFVRANASKVSGKGGTEVLVFIVEDNIAPFSDEKYTEIPFYFKNIIYQDGIGEKYSTEDKTVYLRLNKKISDAPVVLDEKKLILYPNPAGEYLFVHMNGKNSISAYTLYNIEGRTILSNYSPDPKHNTISTTGISNGFYILKVETPLGSISKKIEIMN